MVYDASVCHYAFSITVTIISTGLARFHDPGCAQETKSGRLTTLPPPPNEGKKSGTNDMPRSLQKMLRLKARDNALDVVTLPACNLPGCCAFNLSEHSLWTGAGRAGKQIKEESTCQQREAGSVSTCTWRPAGRRSGSSTSAGLASSEAGASISRRWRQQPAGGEACRGDRATPRRKQQRPEPAGGRPAAAAAQQGPAVPKGKQTGR